MLKKETADSSRKIITIPNILSFFRLALIPLIVWLYLNEYYYWSIAALILSGATDVIDGWVARHFNMVSDVGKALDPVADKLTQIAALLCLAINFKSMAILLVIHVIKEIIMAAFGIAVIKKTGSTYSANWHGKLTTCLLYTTVIIHIFWPNIPSVLSFILVGMCILIMLFSLVMYSRQNIKRIMNTKQK